MNDLNTGNFGLVISYLIPGMTALWGLSYPSTTIRTWLHATAASDPTVAGLLSVTLAAVAAGLLVSTVRWLTVDVVHALTGLRRPPFNYARLAQNIAGFDLLVRHHYEYYKFHGNMLVAVMFVCGARRVSLGSFSLPLDWFDLAVLALLAILAAGSRSTLANYYDRVMVLLGEQSQPPRPTARKRARRESKNQTTWFDAQGPIATMKGAVSAADQPPTSRRIHPNASGAPAAPLKIETTRER